LLLTYCVENVRRTRETVTVTVAIEDRGRYQMREARQIGCKDWIWSVWNGLTLWSTFGFVAIVVAPIFSCLLVVYVALYAALSLFFSDDAISFDDWCNLDRVKVLYLENATKRKKNPHVCFKYITLDDTTRIHTMIWKRNKCSAKKNKKVMVLIHGTVSSAVTSYAYVIHQIGNFFTDIDEIHCIDLPGFAYSSFPKDFKKKVNKGSSRKRRRCCLCCWCCCCRPNFSRNGDKSSFCYQARGALARSVLKYIRLCLRDAKEIVLAGHSVGGYIAVEVARLDVKHFKQRRRVTLKEDSEGIKEETIISNGSSSTKEEKGSVGVEEEKNRKLISKLVMLSPACVLPSAGQGSSFVALYFHWGIPIRQGRFLLGTSFGMRFFYTMCKSIGMNDASMMRWRVRCDSNAWLSDLPANGMSVSFTGAQWMDPILKQILETADVVPFAMIAGDKDPICRVSYVNKIAECIWPESCSKEVFEKNKATRKVQIGHVVETHVKTSGSVKDLSLAPLIFMKNCGHSVMDGPLSQFLCALEMSIRNARIQDNVSRRFTKLLEHVDLHDDVQFRSPFDNKGSNVAQKVLHRRLSDYMDIARGVELEGCVVDERTSSVLDILDTIDIDEEDVDQEKSDEVRVAVGK